MPSAHNQSRERGQPDLDAKALVNDFLDYCEGSSEILSMDRGRHTLVAQSMNAPEDRPVTVDVDPQAMRSMSVEIEDFNLSAIRDDAIFRNDFWGALFQDMMENVETMGRTSRSIRMTPGGPFERSESLRRFVAMIPIEVR
jgi:hypothetical protein